jgi:pantoate--beta-alanine ligase
VRDDDGLALSSRNERLSSDGRQRALAFSKALALVGEKGASASQQRATLRATLEAARIDVAYAEVVDRLTLVPSSDDETGERRALVAGVVEGVRLIDNGPVKIVRG